MHDLDHPFRTASTRLIGRDKDLEFIRSHFSGSVHGAALLLSGEAGIGKTALLDAVAAQARSEGTRVLRSSGVQFEADVSYAGLNQLLVPLFESFDLLDPSHRDALKVAVGIGSGPPPNRLLTSTAALLLLRRIAQDTPLLIVVDDLPWLDRPTTSVLGFVARRLVGSRIGFLAASRVTSDSFFESSGLLEHRLQSLDEASSAELLAEAHPDLSHAIRRRIAAEAHGNPLALVELPTALDREQRTAPTAVPSVLPLSERLQALFAARVADLPEASRELLLIAALEGTGDLAVIEAAAGRRAAVDLLESAERDRLVAISAGSRRLSFRHPLIGFAVVAQASAADRRRAHQGLAAVLTDQPERRAHHLGEATTGPDETVAELLEQAARLRLGRGDALGAMAALTRAAGLSPSSADESRRLAEAAYIGTDAGGGMADASSLLVGARRADPATREESLHAAAASALLLINEEGDVNTAHRLLVGAIEAGGHGYDASDDALVEALFTLITLCWYSGDPEKWAPLFRALDRMTPAPPDLLWVCAQTFADPARTGYRALELLDTLLDDIGDATQVVRVSTCAVYPDRLADVREASLRLVEQGRAGTAPVRRHLSALIHLCLDDYYKGRWDEAVKLAGEGLSLCEDYGYPFFACKFQFVQALVAGARGDVVTSDALSEEIVGWAVPRGAHGARALAFHARCLAALGSGDFDGAFRHATAINPLTPLAPYLPHAMTGALDLVEAAVRSGRSADAATHTAALRESAMARLSPRLHMHVLACEALTTSDGDALGLFEQALSLLDPDDWPFDVARVRLFYGERLRRRRVTRKAREQLVQAAQTFEKLGAAPWAARATAELHASGRATSATVQGKGALTAQEFEIATLAATGLTNKQIGERLFLSHRTIGTHLYQIYPKLGINSRAALRDALAALELEDVD
ncbi:MULTISPECIES: ATP-binding protein [Streptomyces]|uniref:LuxR family transcriptional regulator n=1 Tax=Streptomyces canarius TaxID=285453 RepID=A0ABQ3D9U9_9ACTN|nr:LuxR family transcriptional regulator [Streptomyces canarius]GHA65834.1 LuxR family transcriptional regulator [Streptomyces canarius]